MEATGGEAASGEICFLKFPQLATELRLQIWLYALPRSRTVEIEWCEKSGDWFCPKESQSTQPGISLANKESREVYLKHYKPFLHQGPSSQGQGTCRHKFSSSPQTYIDPTIDILYIGANSENEYCFCPNSMKVLAACPLVSQISTFACELKEWVDGTEEYDIEPYECFPLPPKFIIAWGDIDYEKFEREGVRPDGPLALVVLTQEEEKCDRISGLRELYDKDVKKAAVKGITLPGMTLMRMTRGGKLMENALGI